MKNRILILCSSLFLATFLYCTDDFDEINTQPDALSTDDISAKFFVTNIQQKLLRPTMIPLWFGDVIHPDQFSGQICEADGARFFDPWRANTQCRAQSGRQDTVSCGHA